MIGIQKREGVTEGMQTEWRRQSACIGSIEREAALGEESRRGRCFHLAGSRQERDEQRHARAGARKKERCYVHQLLFTGNGKEDCPPPFTLL